MKRCGRCCEEKEDREFNKDKRRPGGLSNRCKTCKSVEHKEYILKYPEKFQEKYSKRLPEWRSANKEKCKEYSRIDRERKKNNLRKKPKTLEEINNLKEKAKANQIEWKGASKERKKEWIKKYKQSEKYKIQKHARDAIYYGIKFGFIKRPGNCEKCMKECIPEGHHTDYKNPLEVQWLCHICHENAHGKLLDMEMHA